MSAGRPYVVVLGGPNGAGKTTVSEAALAETFELHEFVNADTIARGLSAFDPERSAFEAGRVMLRRLNQLAAQRESFAFESTLASRTFARWLRGLLESGYHFHLIYVWLRSSTLAERRVRQRVRAGGHHIPAEVIRRRYVRSAYNLLHLYLPIATSWRIIDNSTRRPLVVAEKQPGGRPVILQAPLWDRIHETAEKIEGHSEELP